MKNQNKNAFLIISTLLIITLLIISGCAPTNVTPKSQEQTLAGLRSFSSVEEYQAFVQDYSSSSSGGLYYSRNTISKSGGIMASEADVPTSAVSDSVSSGSSGSDAYSQTNNQVASVDEADIIKTDGEYIYTITGNTVYIAKAVPGADAKVVSTFTIDSSYAQNLFVYENKLVVMGTEYGRNSYISSRYIPNSNSAFAYVYDISDKEKPNLETNYTFEGNFNDARLKDGIVYYVAQSQPEYRIDYPMPLIFKNGVESQMPVDRMFFAPVNYDYPITMTVHSIDLKSNSDNLIGSTGIVVESSQTMYMSQENIYFAASTYVNEWQIRQEIEKKTIEPLLTQEQVNLIARVNAVDTDILSKGEKESKILSIYYDRLYSLDQKEQQTIEDEVNSKLKVELSKYDYFEHTVINKLSYKDGVVTPVASGKIAGSVNNQFSLNEHNGVLAVATTVHQRWSSFIDFNEEPVAMEVMAATAPSVAADGSRSSSDVALADSKMSIMPPRPTNEPSKSENMVFTLDADLNVIGSLKNIAKGEQIYSTRFDGDRLYMVTFRQVDPFFVIDLSDATNPTILGQLKLPGFSRYLHPVGDNLVLGLGQDATKEGRIKGLKVTLFDASDVANPKELSSYVGTEDYAQSTALFDHHAFLYSAEKELLVIPVLYYNYDYYSKDSQSKSYAGALVFHVDNKSIELRGLVDHAQGSTDIWSKQVERSLYIGDLLYTKSQQLLRINNIDDLTSVADVKLPIKSEPEGIVVY